MFEINEMQKVPLDGIMDNVDEQDNWFHYVRFIQYRNLLELYLSFRIQDDGDYLCRKRLKNSRK